MRRIYTNLGDHLDSGTCCISSNQLCLDCLSSSRTGLFLENNIMIAAPRVQYHMNSGTSGLGLGALEQICSWEI